MDTATRSPGKIPAWSDTGLVAQLVFKTIRPAARPDPPRHDKTGLAGISPQAAAAAYTLRHAGTGCSRGQETDEGRGS